MFLDGALHVASMGKTSDNFINLKLYFFQSSDGIIIIFIPLMFFKYTFVFIFVLL